MDEISLSERSTDRVLQHFVIRQLLQGNRTVPAPYSPLLVSCLYRATNFIVVRT